jgi:hypothetical protein
VPSRQRGEDDLNTPTRPYSSRITPKPEVIYRRTPGLTIQFLLHDKSVRSWSALVPALSDIWFWDNFSCPVCAFNHCRETCLIFATNSFEFQT